MTGGLQPRRGPCEADRLVTRNGRWPDRAPPDDADLLADAATGAPVVPLPVASGGGGHVLLVIVALLLVRAGR